jgi:hypothetical protein
MYTKLPNSRSFRLLYVAPGQAEEVIEVILLVMDDLDKAPEFEALSYVWGTPKDPVDILCDDEVTSVTRNLAGALQQLRQTDTWRIIWIDAVCINQKDLEERAQQVSLMRYIYSRAKRVVIWLGPDNEGRASKAISMISYAVRYFEENLTREAPAGDIIFKRQEDPKFNANGELPPLGHPDWDSVSWLYEREWFTRVWIIQEVAQDAFALMLIGNLSILWGEVAIAASIFFNKYYGRTGSDLNLVRVMNLCSTAGAALGLEPPPTLLSLISKLSAFNATDARDKLFAILGISLEGQQLEISPMIRPNYQKSIIETFTDLVRYLISRPRGQAYGKGGLDVLGRNDIKCFTRATFSPAKNFTNDNNINSVAEEDLPSWVPPFHRNVPHFMPLSERAPGSSWTTSYNSAVGIGSHASPSSLILEGVRLTTVKHVYGTSIYYDYECETPIVVAALLSQVKTDLHGYKGPDSIGEAFAQTFTASFRNSSSKDVFHEIDLEEYIENRKAGIQTLSDTEFEEFAFKVPVNPMFVTDDGHIGIGSPGQPGDEIWILFGGSVLYIIRRMEDCFTFVGECYVHGYMHGEGMDIWKSGQLKSEWVDLR